VKLKAEKSQSERPTYSVVAEGLGKVSVASIDETVEDCSVHIQCHYGGGKIVSVTELYIDRIWSVLF
jgi:hypothetical protein